MPSDIKIWKFTPVANAEDSRWLDHHPVAALYVAAESPAMARVVAANASVPPREGKVGNESGHSHSRFEDEKLYRVDEANADEVNVLPAAPQQSQVIGETREDGSFEKW